MEKVKKWNYGNRGNNSDAVKFGDLVLYFSYNTVIACKYKNELIISKNQWSNTTARHLNCIDSNKEIRLEKAEFEKRLNSVLNKINL